MGFVWTKKKDSKDDDAVSPWTKLKDNEQGHAIEVIKEHSFKAALFDLDGTLFDTEPQYTIFWGMMARKYRPDVPRLEYAIKGTTLKQIFDTYFPDKQVQKEITAKLNEWEAQMKYVFVPGALDYLRDLKEHGVKCAVVTSSNIAKMQSVARQIPEFNSLFDCVLTAEDFPASKPAPDCYLIGARVFLAAIDECVVFEDAFTGLQAGMASGILTVGLTTSLSDVQIADKCHFVISDFTEMTYERTLSMLAERK